MLISRPQRLLAGSLPSLLAAGILASCDSGAVGPDPGRPAAAPGRGTMQEGPPLTVETSLLPPALVGSR